MWSVLDLEGSSLLLGRRAAQREYQAFERLTTPPAFVWEKGLGAGRGDRQGWCLWQHRGGGGRGDGGGRRGGWGGQEASGAMRNKRAIICSMYSANIRLSNAA